MPDFDATKDLSQELLDRNLKRWSEAWGCEKAFEPDSNPASRVLVTHTFPSQKRWAIGSRDLCREILEDGQGLLSDQARNDGGLYRPGEPRPRMPHARAIKLNHFVFAYLGVHDPFYSRSPDGVPMAAFGLFMRRELEAFPYCNVTRRDAASSESQFSDDPGRDFLDSSGARELCACQVAKHPDHNHDFWHYWGAAEFCVSRPNYLNEHWKWKFEFHFRDRVSVDGLEAILWPDVEAASAAGASRRASWYARAEQFRQRNPSCKVIFYDWNWRAPIKSLLDASTAVTRYLLQNGEFPPFAGDALAVFPPAS